MSARRRDWQSRLSALLAERHAAEFAWGTNDCCIFACDCVLVQTGEDPAEGLRAHRTAAEAARVLQEHGGVAGLAAERLGPEIVPGLAQVGDIGLAVLGDRETLVVCGGDHWLAPKETVGLASLPRDSVSRAWRCERCPA